MSAGKVWTIFSVGVAAGAIVALFYAPQSGARTRRQVRRSVRQAADYVKDTAETISGNAEKCVQRGKNLAGNVKDSASSAYSAARKVVSM
jgi:gas vesicle protein